MDISKITHWIFDMDGTLTVPVHDFVLIRNELGVPQNEDILDYFNTLPDDEKVILETNLEAMEIELAHKGTAQNGVEELLTFLTDRGDQVGILTRNNRLNTTLTLEAAGIAHFFKDETIFTRENAIPKPHPDAIHQLLEMWDATAETTAILGDYKHDLEAGASAGVGKIYFDSKGIALWNDLADLTLLHWDELIELL